MSQNDNSGYIKEVPESVFKKPRRSPSVGLRNSIYVSYIQNTEHILGKILTIIDSSISDPEQRKAFKDLVKGEYYGSRLSQLEFGEIIMSFCEQYCVNYGTEDVTKLENVMSEGDEMELLGIVQCECPETPKFDFKGNN